MDVLVPTVSVKVPTILMDISVSNLSMKVPTVSMDVPVPSVFVELTTVSVDVLIVFVEDIAVSVVSLKVSIGSIFSKVE